MAECIDNQIDPETPRYEEVQDPLGNKVRIDIPKIAVQAVQQDDGPLCSTCTYDWKTCQMQELLGGTLEPINNQKWLRVMMCEYYSRK